MEKETINQLILDYDIYLWWEDPDQNKLGISIASNTFDEAIESLPINDLKQYLHNYINEPIEPLPTIIQNTLNDNNIISMNEKQQYKYMMSITHYILGNNNQRQIVIDQLFESLYQDGYLTMIPNPLQNPLAYLEYQGGRAWQHNNETNIYVPIEENLEDLSNEILETPDLLPNTLIPLPNWARRRIAHTLLAETRQDPKYINFLATQIHHYLIQQQDYNTTIQNLQILEYSMLHNQDTNSLSKTKLHA